MDETGTGVRMKSERGRGGVVEDVTYRKLPRYRCRLGCILLKTAAILLLTGRIHMKDIAGQCVQVTLNCERTVALAQRL